MQIYLSFVVFLMGLCAGSFVNMLVYRTARRYGLKHKSLGATHHPPFDIKGTTRESRSFCDYCGRQLRWYENVPVVSWMLQRGETRCCGKKLPIAYPIVELITGLLFVATFIITNNQAPITKQLTNNQLPILQIFNLILELVIVTMLIFEAEFDRRYMILPDFGIGILVISALVLWRFSALDLFNVFLSAAGAGGFLLLLHLFTKGKGMGMGDVKMAVFMGLFLGYPKIIYAFYIAFIVGAIYGIGLILRKRNKKYRVIPFGPFLILGTIAAWWGGELINKFLMSKFL